MSPSKIYETRFIAPPLITIALVFLYDPAFFYGYVSSSDLLSGIVVLASLNTLVLGFLISSCVNFIISFITDFRMPHGNTEIEVWSAMDSKPYVKEQLHKRWNLAIANFNASFAAAIAPAILGLCMLWLNIPPTQPCWLIAYFSIIILIVVIFLYNGITTYITIIKIDKEIIAIHEFEKLEAAKKAAAVPDPQISQFGKDQKSH